MGPKALAFLYQLFYNMSMRTPKLFLFLCVSTFCFSSVHAQRQLEYVSEMTKGVKFAPYAKDIVPLELQRQIAVAVPYVIDTKLLPLEVQRQISGTVERVQVVTNTRPSLIAAGQKVQLQTARAMLGNSAAMKRTVMARTNTAADNSMVPATTSARLDTQQGIRQEDFLTGPQMLKLYHPGWKSELSSIGFYEDQIRAIEKAFVVTDRKLFEVDKKGNWVKPLSKEWDYSAFFSLEGFTESQYGVIYEKFHDVFVRLDFQGFVLVHKRAPGEKSQLGRQYASLGKKEISSNLTPQQVYEGVLQYLRKTGNLPLLNSKNPTESALRRAFNRIVKSKNLGDPFVVRLKEFQTLWGRTNSLGITDHD